MPTVRSLDSVFADVKKSFPTKKVSFEKKDYSIPKLFKPTFKDKKFQVVLRFLPCKPGEDSMYIENRTHMLQLPNGKYYGCDCLRKFDNPEGEGKLECPICTFNNKVWTAYGSDANVARQKALPKWAPKYYCNVLIVRNPNAPDTEGEVFRFEFKRQIMKILSEAMEDKKDELDGSITKGINPFSWYGPKDAEVLEGKARAGANFIFVGEEGPMGPTYAKSHFNEPSRISKVVNGTVAELTDSEIDVVESQLLSLAEFERKLSDAQDFKSILTNYKRKSGMELFAEFPDLLAKYSSGQDAVVAQPQRATFQTQEVDDDELFSGTPLETPKSTSAPAAAPKAEPAEDMSNDDFFNSLMAQ